MFAPFSPDSRMNKNAQNIEDWIRAESIAKQGNDYDNQRAREEQIEERLLALGWTEERYVNRILFVFFPFEFVLKPIYDRLALQSPCWSTKEIN